MNLSDEIKRLADLHAAGSLSEEEFIAAKKRLLGTDSSSVPPMPTAQASASFSYSSNRPALISDPERSEARARNWAMWLHLSLLAGFVVAGLGFIAPVVIWLTMKSEIPALDEHGKEVVNWMISLFIYSIISAILIFVFIGVPLLVLCGALGVIFPIIGGIKASEGILWRYPLTIRFIR